MKKILFSAFALFSFMGMSAENSLQIVPFKANPGTDVYASIVLNNETPVCWLQFDLYTPDGIRVYTNKSGNLISSSFAIDNSEGRMNYYDEDEEDNVGAFAGMGATMGSNFVTVGGKECFRFGGAGDFPIKGNSGKVFTIRIKVADTVAPGVYPIVMKNIKLQNNDATGPTDLEYASYIVVGEPTAATLALENEIPSFVNEALATETAISKLDLTDVTAVNGTFTYVDGREVVAPTASVEANLKYVGNNDNYYSVNVPFTGTVTGKAYKFVSNDDKFATFTETTEAAGKTLLAEGEVTVTGHGAIAGVEKLTGQSGNYVKGGTFFYGDNLTVKPMRGLFEGTSLSNLRVVVDGELTGINAAEIDAQSNTFDLQGRQVQNAKNGVFVVNGKKQFVK